MERKKDILESEDFKNGNREVSLSLGVYRIGNFRKFPQEPHMPANTQDLKKSGLVKY